MDGIRYANIGAAVAFVILVVGRILLRNAGEGALHALVVVAFISCFVVYVTLDERAKRRHKHDQ
ncbi:MAG: hypothetical protein WA687_04790 [Solirubrobacterales bacterium]